MAGTVLAKLLNMRVSMALQGWAYRAAEQSRLRMAASRVVVRMQKNLSAVALDGWSVHAQEQQIMRAMAIKVNA